MAVATSLVKNEVRRHMLMTVGLVASCAVSATVVTNERGLFVPIGIHGMSETARAFAAMFTPSHLLPGFTNVQSIAPLEPFDVTADPLDLRRRLMDAFSDFSGPAGIDPAQDIAQYGGDQTLTPTELAANDATPQAASATPASSDSGQGGQTATSTGNTATNGSASPLQRSPADLLTSSQTQANSEPTDGGSNVTNPVDPTPPDTTAPVPEPSMWAMMLAGFGVVGYMMRSSRRRRAAEAAA